MSPEEHLGAEVDAAVAQAQLERILHAAHHGDDAVLFAEVVGAERDVLEATLICAVTVLTNRPTLLAYARRLGWLRWWHR